MNYDDIKAYALEHGGRVEDLLAMSRANDPFYCAQPSHVLQAQWFMSLWERFDFPQGVHLRRIHYVLVSQDPPVLDACATAYANTERCWKLLGKASRAARWLELMPLSAFTDRRNPEPALAEEIENPLYDSARDYFEQLEAYKTLPPPQNLWVKTCRFVPG